jgi:hypothetical protein
MSLHLVQVERPAIGALIIAMGKLSRRKRIEIALLGRRAPSAKDGRIRRLTSAAAAEARRLAREGL